MPQLVILDESRASKHPIMGVGGIVVELDEVPAIERRWSELKAQTGTDRGPVKYSMSWPDRSSRSDLIAAVGEMPVRGVAVLLEDLRPMRLKLRKETRSDIYVYTRAFEWLLQRLASPFYSPSSQGPHLVVFDLRDDLRKLAAEYARHHPTGWTFARGSSLPSLQSLGYSASLYAAEQGPLIEIADLVISALTRWAGGRCEAHHLKQVSDLGELERDCAALRDRFPAKGSAGQRWRGYSIVTFRENRAGKELLHDHLDRWLRDLPTSSGEPSDEDITLGDDDIPF